MKALLVAWFLFMGVQAKDVVRDDSYHPPGGCVREEQA